MQAFQERNYVHGTHRPHDENDISGTRPMKKIEEPNHDGLESAKPDLQSLFKKPGGAIAEL